MVTSPDAQPQENEPFARPTTARLENKLHTNKTSLTQEPHTLLREWWRRGALRPRQKTKPDTPETALEKNRKNKELA